MSNKGEVVDNAVDLISCNIKENTYEDGRSSPSSIEKFCTGFFELYVDNLKSITTPLDELNRNQEVLIETVQQENSRYADAKQSLNLEEMFTRIAQYQAKLAAIKKEMVSLHDKAVKLKKKALKLQAIKEKEIGSKET